MPGAVPKVVGRPLVLMPTLMQPWSGMVLPGNSAMQMPLASKLMTTWPFAPAPPFLVVQHPVRLAPPPPPPGASPAIPFPWPPLRPSPPSPPPVGAVPPFTPLPSLPSAAVPAEEPPPPPWVPAPLAPSPPLKVTSPMHCDASPPGAPAGLLLLTLPPPFARIVVEVPNHESPPGEVDVLPAPTVTV